MTDVGLEEQFVLRVPPEVAKQIHHMMKDNDLDDIEFSFTDPRNGKFTIEGQDYKLSLLDLPCVVETHKTLDMRSYYKSGDIGQMLLVEGKRDNKEKKEGEDAQAPKKIFDHQYRLVDMGVTPATKNIRQRKFRKRPEVPREEVLAAEEELLRRMRGDAYAASENIEIVHESELFKELGMPAPGADGEKKTPKKRKRKADAEGEGAEGENGEKPKKKRRKKSEAADGATADGAAAGDGANPEEGKKPKKPRKKKEEKEGEPKEKKERKKKAPKAQATAPENISTVVAANNNTNAGTSTPQPMHIVQETKPVNPRVAELNENLARLRSDVNALQKQVDGDIAAVPLELNEVMRGRLEAKIARQQATISSKTALIAAIQQELSALV
jgi:transcription initiation factor TFIID subunit 7